jgi:hypothetical protein
MGNLKTRLAERRIKSTLPWTVDEMDEMTEIEHIEADEAV